MEGRLATASQARVSFAGLFLVGLALHVSGTDPFTSPPPPLRAVEEPEQRQLWLRAASQGQMAQRDAGGRQVYGTRAHGACPTAANGMRTLAVACRGQRRQYILLSACTHRSWRGIASRIAPGLRSVPTALLKDHSPCCADHGIRGEGAHEPPDAAAPTRDQLQRGASRGDKTLTPSQFSRMRGHQSQGEAHAPLF